LRYLKLGNPDHFWWDINPSDTVACISQHMCGWDTSTQTYVEDIWSRWQSLEILPLVVVFRERSSRNSL
jgi:hypothetical protein